MDQRYFHVDSNRSLTECAAITTRAIPQELDRTVADCFRALYPTGLSSWGYDYLFEDNGEGLIFDEPSNAALGLTPEERDNAIRRARNRTIEMIAELVRINWAPECPSRLTAVFAYSTLEVAREFRETRCTDPTAPIWEVKAERAFGCDASWLGLGGSIPFVFISMRQYWKGADGPRAPVGGADNGGNTTWLGPLLTGRSGPRVPNRPVAILCAATVHVPNRRL
jgi:hypothetical protein